MENANKVISENIKVKRKEAGLTQDELAAKLGVTFQAVSKWETELCSPDILLLPDLADIFGCTIDALFSRKTVRDTTPEAKVCELPWEDDGLYRAAVYQGKRMLSAKETTGRFTFEIAGSFNGKLYTECDVHIDGDLNSDCCTNQGNITVGGDIRKSCSANGDVNVGGDIGGDCASANGNISVYGDVGGGCAAARGSISVDGDVGGDCECGGNITVVGDVGGDCECGGNITVDGDIGGYTESGCDPVDIGDINIDIKL